LDEARLTRQRRIALIRIPQPLCPSLVDAKSRGAGRARHRLVAVGRVRAHETLPPLRETLVEIARIPPQLSREFQKGLSFRGVIPWTIRPRHAA